MEDSQILVFSLFFFFLGLASLFFLSNSSKPLEKNPGDISEEDAGKHMLVKGSVSKFFYGPSFNSFKLCSANCISVVDFEKRFKVKNGDFVSAEGTVKEFEGDLELIALSVEVLNPA